MERGFSGAATLLTKPISILWFPEEDGSNGAGSSRSIRTIPSIVFKPTDMIDTNPGVIRFGSRVVDEDKHHNYGVLSFTDVIVRSSNVGAIKIGLRVGSERLGLYARRFGFGHPTSPDLPCSQLARYARQNADWETCETPARR